MLALIRGIWLVVGLPMSIPEAKWLLVGQRLGDGYTMYKDLYDTTAPLAAMTYKWLDIVFGQSRWVHIVLSTVLVTLQAAVLNKILIRHKAFNDNTYWPALFYILLASSTGDFFALSPQLISLTFILLSLNHIFRRIDNQVTDELFLFSGLYLGLATLYYLPAAIFFLIFMLSFIFFSSAIPRRLLLLAYGASVGFIPVWGYFFWYNAGYDFLSSFFVAGSVKPREFYITYPELVLTGAFLIGSTLLAMVSGFLQRVTNFQQKMRQVMLLFLIGGIALLFLTRELASADLMFIVPSAAFFMVYFFSGLRRKIWRRVMPPLILGGLVIYTFVIFLWEPPKSMMIGGASHSLTNQRIMGIGLPVTGYQGNELAGPFLDSYLTTQKLDELDYYNTASEVQRTLEISRPDVIVDELSVLGKVFHRFPAFGEQYHAVDSVGYFYRIEEGGIH